MKIYTPFLVTYYVVFVTQLLLGQDTLQINFGPNYHMSDDEGHSFMKLIDNHNNAFKYDGTDYSFTYPQNFSVNDTAIAFNYFTGWENAFIKNTTAFLFGNYKSRSPIVYVDYNHNLDFSDDGLPLQFEEEKGLTLYLENSNIPTAKFSVNLFYPDLNEEQKEQIKTFIKPLGPEAKGNNIVPIEFWLADKRKNCKITNTSINNNPLKIGLYDYNCNGLFDDIEKDRIMIGDNGKSTISKRLQKGAITYTNNTLISIMGITYEVIEIETSGKYIKIVKSKKIYHKPIGIGDNISDLKIELVSGEIITIKDLLKENSFLLLDFWGSWCKGCTQQLPELKNLARASRNMEVIGINYGDDLNEIERYLVKHDIKWKNGKASEAIIKKLRVDGFPNYLLIDQDGNILIMDGTIEEIRHQL